MENTPVPAMTMPPAAAAPPRAAANKQAERMEKLLDRINQTADEKSRSLVKEFVNEILTFYGNGLEKIVENLKNGNGQGGESLLHSMLSDSYISGLLLLHNLHPDPLETRLNKALDKTRPYIEGHGGSLELVSLDNSAAVIRFSGTCQSCSFSAVTLELSIKKAIDEYCPDLAGLEVLGLEDLKKQKEPELAGISVAVPRKNHVLHEANALKNGEIKFSESNGAAILLGRINDQMHVYYNQCPACAMPMQAASLQNNIISCRLGHRYDLGNLGAGLDLPGQKLKPFPVNE